MAETMEENELQKRSDKCLKLVQDTAKEITLGVSFERFREIAPTIGISNGIYKHLQNAMTDYISNRIKDGFNEMNIPEKMEALDKLAKETPTDNVAWRPVTGTVDISAIEAWGLALRKAELQKKLARINNENEKLKQIIVDKRKLIEQGHDEVKSVLNDIK